jgi:hypothetical protein
MYDLYWQFLMQSILLLLRGGEKGRTTKALSDVSERAFD